MKTIKQTLIVFSLVSTSITARAQDSSAINFVGTWICFDSAGATSLKLQVLNHRFLTISLNGLSSDSLEYFIDLNSRPVKFDINVKKGRKITPWYGLIKFVTPIEGNWQISLARPLIEFVGPSDDIQNLILRKEVEKR